MIHVLVSLVLVLNGICAAAASIHINTPPADGARRVASSGNEQGGLHADAMQSVCRGYYSAASAQDADGGSDHANSGISDGWSCDCCESDACNGGCAHHSHVAFVSAWLVTPAIVPGAKHWKAQASHSSTSRV